jgi:hypothetical protein
MDEVHSMLSREKGLAGMAENVRRGHRAGGRAPIGYRLERIPTGAIRDGAPVTKSKLEPSEQAPAIAAISKARAAGEAARAARALRPRARGLDADRHRAQRGHDLRRATSLEQDRRSSRGRMRR